MPLEPSAKLGAYEVLSLIGAGGMGEIYRAKDIKLGREVAIKVLPAELSQDKDRLARFEREAKFLAALNHPCIATLYILPLANLHARHGVAVRLRCLRRRRVFS